MTAEVLERIAAEVAVSGEGAVEHARLGRLELPPAEGTSVRAATLRLAHFLYLHYHAGDREEVRALLAGEPRAKFLPDWEEPAFVETLIGALQSQGQWRQGWRVIAVHDNGISVGDGKLRLLAAREEIDAPVVAPRRPCRVRFPAHLRYGMPGWCSFSGDVGVPHADPARHVLRVYWGIGSVEGARQLVALLSGALNEAACPFALKIVNHPSALARADAAVLYVRADDLTACRPLLAAVRARLAPALSGALPGFACPVAPGVAMADEPDAAGRVSFGQHRAHLVAVGLVSTAGAGERDRLAGTEEALRGAGVPPDAPYRSSRSDPTLFADWSQP